MGDPVSPVEKRIDLLARLWLEVAQTPDLRVVVWRIPPNADAMLGAFFEAHRQADEALTPDLFVTFDTAFDTGFGYSRALIDALWEGYANSRETLIDQGVGIGWRGAHETWSDSASGVVGMFASFADHHRARMRFFVPVLMPSQVLGVEAFGHWIDHAVGAIADAPIRLALVDHADNPHWDALQARHPDHVRIVEAPIDMFDIARETAAQAGGAGPAVAYRQMFTDVLAATEKGSAAQAASRADRALALAARQGWHDQQAALNMTVAGAHLKERDTAKAIARYRAARENGAQAHAAGNPAGLHLVMQAWFGEGGAWFLADQPERAAEAYLGGAEAARSVPNPMFALEGQRMAGFCLARARQHGPAQGHYLRGLRDARDMAPDDRPMTTLPLLLQDMLRLEDASRTGRLEAVAEGYQRRVADAQAEAERDASRLGQQPDPKAIRRIEARMEDRFGQAFDASRQERERLIAGGNEMFRKIVSVGRDYLHDGWNGLPDIKHPLDAEPATWEALPEYAQLPDAASLEDDGAGTAAAEPIAMEKTA
ncbi:hypothetical protein [Luteimonas abyssi]|uniref:hypothetical protein n=1 Tax=Luteimonas abyssi TaxID=1247514 RepID=UPI000737B327|nr:hypothetical protein [Luteimonas abyssi]